MVVTDNMVWRKIANGKENVMIDNNKDNEEFGAPTVTEFMEPATELIAHCLNKGAAMKQTMAEEHSLSIASSAWLMIDRLRQGGKILIMGNGGSAADAQHFAAEMVGRFLIDRPGLPAIALSCNGSNMTSLGNDFGFEFVFSRQVEALAVEGDIVVGISTSGNSPNVVEALRVAKSLGCVTIGLAGNTGGDMLPFCDASVVVPTKDTPLIQECHIAVIHIWCDLIEQALFDTNVEETDDDLLDDDEDSDE